MILIVCAMIFFITCTVYSYKLYQLRNYEWNFVKVREFNYTSEELVVDYRKRLKRKIAVSFSLLLLIGILYFLQQNVEAFKDAVSIDLLFSAPFSDVK